MSKRGFDFDQLRAVASSEGADLGDEVPDLDVREVARTFTETELVLKGCADAIVEDIQDQMYALIRMIGSDPVGLLLGADPWQLLGCPDELFGLRVTVSGERQGVRVLGDNKTEAHRAWGLVTELDQQIPDWRTNPRAWRKPPGGEG